MLLMCIWSALFVVSLGGVTGVAEPNHKINNSMHYNPVDHQGALNRLPYPYTNGHSCHPPACQESSVLSDEQSAEEDSSEEEDDDEEECYSPKWKGIEGIYEAYHEYLEGESCSQAASQVFFVCFCFKTTSVLTNITVCVLREKCRERSPKEWMQEAWV